jgi:hypothetical protein
MRQYSVDPQRVYVGGLSAGAAAAAVMGATYPDLYAAIGVHSGLACGAANDLPSAFVAMRQADFADCLDSSHISIIRNGVPVPTIVFHGDRDTTVNPRNGDHVIARSMRNTNLRKTVHRGRVPGGHAYTRTIHTDPNGRANFEHWQIHGAGQARSPIGEDRTPRGKCCASSSNTDTRPPTCDRVRTRFVAANDSIAEVAVPYSITSSSESRLSDIDPQPWDHNGHVGAADVTSSVITLKPASVQGPNEVTIATSVASRPRAMRIRANPLRPPFPRCQQANATTLKRND